jgi:hypothetical protein
MENEGALSAYKPDKIKPDEKLPDRLSSVAHDIDVAEGKSRLKVVNEQVGQVAAEIHDRTHGTRFVILGSMGMYTALGSLGPEGSPLLPLLEDRIAKGKNDIDVAVDPEALSIVMSRLAWDTQAQHAQRGYVGESRQIVDMLGRTELPHFPWVETHTEKATFCVQRPEEMIFEKMWALIRPREENAEESSAREAKWGVDIKLLKTSMMMTNGWTETQTEIYLAKKWDEYLEDTRYREVTELANKVGLGSSASEVVTSYLQERLGQPIVDPKETLFKIFGRQSADIIDNLLHSQSASSFSEAMRHLLDERAGGKLYYADATHKAEQIYAELIVPKH